MLEELRVKNYALIDDVSVHFGPGFNVLTGETGAGKSILIDALSLILGGKGKSESVRQGVEEAEVTAVLHTPESEALQQWCSKYGIYPEDGSLLIRRTLRVNGRGTSSIQAVPVTRVALAELASFQVDLHGQHEHQSLSQISTHRRLLDRFAGLEDKVRRFTEKFTELTKLDKRIEELSLNREQMLQEASFLRHALEEIESAELKHGEEEALEKRQKVLSRHEELTANLERAFNTSAESRNGAVAFLRKTSDGLNKALRIDSTLGDLKKRLDTVFYEIEDIVNEIRMRREGAEFDSAELEQIDERLARIKALEKKHTAATVAEILAYAKQAEGRLNTLDHRDDEIHGLSESKDRIQRDLISEAKALSHERKSAALLLQQRVEEHLESLGMTDAHFDVSLSSKRGEQGKSAMGPYGIDDIEFLLSANRGEPLRPLSTVASGGELSRVMLALKTVLIESDPVLTMIFDEVDAGIGGEVARSVGEHLYELSRSKQIFCITHLATIAVFANNHFQVMKRIINERTVTEVSPIEGVSRVREVARMLAGDKEDSTSFDHALRLLNSQGYGTDISAMGTRSGKD